MLPIQMLILSLASNDSDHTISVMLIITSIFVSCIIISLHFCVITSFLCHAQSRHFNYFVELHEHYNIRNNDNMDKIIHSAIPVRLLPLAKNGLHSASSIIVCTMRGL